MASWAINASSAHVMHPHDQARHCRMNLHALSLTKHAHAQEALRKLHSALSGRMSQTQRECDDIMDLATPAGTRLDGPEATPHQGQPHSFYSPPSSPEDEDADADAADAHQQNFDQRADAVPAAAVVRQHRSSSSQDIDKARRSMDAEFLRRAGSVQATPRGNPPAAAAMFPAQELDPLAADDPVRESSRGKGMGPSRVLQWAELPERGASRDIEDGGGAPGRLITGVFASGTPTQGEGAWGGLSLDLEALSQVSEPVALQMVA